MNMKLDRYKLALLVATVIWGSSFVVMKNVTESLSVSYLLALRFTIGTIMLSLIYWKHFSHITKSDIKLGLGIGCLLFCGFFIQTLGITDTTPGKNAFLTATYCVFVPFVYWAVDRHRPDGYQFSAAFLCLFGIGLVSLTTRFTIGMGDAATLISSVFYALHIVAVSKFTKGKDPILMTILQLGCSAALSWLAVLFSGSGVSALDSMSFLSVLLLGVGATGIGMLLQNYGQQGTTASTASLLLSLEAVFGILFSVLFYHEHVTLQMLLGFICIFSAIILSETKLSFLKKK
ncbi:MAG: DMT family transporter [Erysipelotrichaceae bacterium]|nr:DMT family transporter [Erysipelotrichaceae bacterium]